jgi:hypothetical protein
MTTQTAGSMPHKMTTQTAGSMLYKRTTLIFI